MSGLLMLIGLGFNVIGSLVLISSNRELIKSIVTSFKRIENNMTIGRMGEDEWFPNGWESGFQNIVKNNQVANRFAFIILAIGFAMQFISMAITVFC